MDTHDNDEPLTFSKLGLAAALILNRIRNAQTLRDLTQVYEQQNKESPHQTEPGNQREENAADELDDIGARIAARIIKIG